MTRSENGAGFVVIWSECQCPVYMKQPQTHAEADSVEVVLVILDVRELFGNMSASSQEHAIGKLPVGERCGKTPAHAGKR